MSIIKIEKHRHNFTIIDKGFLDNTDLSFKAKGLLAWLLSRPDDWQVYLSHLVTVSTDGREAVRSGIAELEAAGYVSKKPSKDKDGTFDGWDYTIREVPKDPECEQQPESEDNAENQQSTEVVFSHFGKHVTTKDRLELRNEGDTYPDAETGNQQSYKAEEIYKLYPKKVGRGIALKAIRRAMNKVPYEKLLESVREYSAAVARWPEQEKQFVPFPATWFNQGRWDDDRSNWRRSSGSQSVKIATIN